jgi:hypothetical protein
VEVRGHFPWLLLVFSETRGESAYVPIDFPGVPFWLVSEPGLLNAVLYLLATCLLLVCYMVYISTRKMEAVMSFETHMNFQWTTRSYIKGHPFSQYFQFIPV